MLAHNYFQTLQSALLKTFLPEQLNLEGQWEVAIWEISYPSMYQNVTEGKFMFFDWKFSNSSDFYYLEPGLYPSFTDIVVEVMNTLFPERRNHSESCISVKVSRITQKVYLANEGSGLASFSTDFGHICGSNFRHKFGVLFRGIGPHKPRFAYDVVRVHSHDIQRFD